MKATEFLKNNEKKIVNFLQKLVQTPSQNGIDPEKDIAQVVIEKLKEFALKPRLIGDKERPSVMCVFGKNRRKRLFLNAHLDTVPAGDPKKWQYPPFSGEIVDQKMYGRGVADTKAGIAIFSYLAGAIVKTETKLSGQLILGFDSDEESGNLNGFKNLMKEIGKIDAAMIGYPGMEEIVIGSRGFLRLKITTFGKAAHTGSRSQKGINAILRMNKIISVLERLSFIKDSPFQIKSDPLFNFGPKLTISQIFGGRAINIVPEQCFINVDIRLVPNQAKDQVVQQIKRALDSDLNCKIDILKYQPAFETDPQNPIVKILKKNAEGISKRKIKLVASGGGGIGNILGKMQIPTIAGFGVEFDNVHANNEWINIETILPVAKIYLKTVTEFLS